ncbi:unnamed protein product [Dracunculus medinensis]|uniref:Uncharacterized protein n=1 Tax=Dracunculus medinensis TaxID=318479 RepID=A0A0N4UDU2_DRAME|nr:unnamed protein product [Dracunculus medinensis]
MTERIRFPYASSVIAPNRFMKSAMSEQVNNYCQFSFFIFEILLKNGFLFRRFY